MNGAPTVGASVDVTARSSDPFRLDGKVAIVTGWSRGIGRAIAAFLSAPASRFFTGQTIVADGGATIVSAVNAS